MPNSRTACIVAASIFGGVAPPVLAQQTTPAPPVQPAPAPSATPAPASDVPSQDIVVTGERPSVVTSIDRKSYSLKNDLQATSGSAADVLRNLPSVSVDIDGNPSLRGDANVQILVDGRPDPQFNSATRGVALQQLGADAIDRIEVLTNPPANFKPDGSGGVINIITKRGRGGRAATAQASGGTGGRFSLGATGSRALGRLTLRGTLAVRRDIRYRFTEDDKLVKDAASGAAVADSQLAASARTDRLTEKATLGADLSLGPRDQVSADGSFSHRFEHSRYRETDLERDAGGATLRRFGRDRPGTEAGDNNSQQLRFQHDFDRSGSNLTVLAQRAEATEDRRLRYANTFDQPALAPTYERQRLAFVERTRELSVDYTRVLPAGRKLILGYDLERSDNGFDNVQTVAAATMGALAPDPSFTNRFDFGQTIQAGYGSYELPVGDLTLLAGLRVEHTSVQTDQVTGGQRGRQSYTRYYPNLHVTDKLTDHQTLNASFGYRVIRPEADELNPYPVLVDAFTIRAGNPNLLPQEIQSFEAGWSYDKGATSRSATLYFRRVRNAFTTVTTPLDANTVLITRANLGRSQSGGLELAMAGKLGGGLGYTLSGNVLYSQINAANLGFGGTRSTFGYDAKAALNWTLSPGDTAQVNLEGRSRRLTPQGYRAGSIGLDLGFRHRLRDALNLTATVSDLLGTRREDAVIDVPGLYEVTRRRPTARTFLLGLSWSLAASKKADGFQYEN
nr:outer membrane beta-barrel family protein [Sphingomonas melonis]